MLLHGYVSKRHCAATVFTTQFLQCIPAHIPLSHAYVYTVALHLAFIV